MTRVAGLAAAGIGICVALGVAGCGDGEAGAGAGSADATKVSFMYAGPMHDDGYNQGNFDIGTAIAEHFGDQVEVTHADNVPYTEQAGKVAQQLIATGTDVIIDTSGYGDVLDDVCRAHPDDVVCLIPLPQGELGENMAGYYPEWWKQEYVLGAAAGLLTESDVIGAVNPLSIPLTNSYMNSFLLGCQATNPKCTMRTVTINSYYDPSTSTQAATTLANAGADILTGWVNDSSPCQVAQQRDLLAFGHYYDYVDACPDALVRTAVWGGDEQYNAWFIDQVEAARAGTFAGGDTHLIEFGKGANLSQWGAKTPAEVKERADAIAQELKTGKLDPFQGPMTDNKGEQRVPEGEKLTEEFLVSGWDWRLKGLIGQ
jgi:simple sugar transport system substrate-binding protein